MNVTEVAFHFNIPERLRYVSRLLRKAVVHSESVVLVAAPEVLQQVDHLLWQLAPTEFIGHCLLAQPEQAQSAEARHARLWLMSDVSQCERHDVLVSLLPEVPAGFEQFARLIEVVTLDEQDRTQARLRWKHYTSRGYQIVRHDVQVRG